MPEIVDDIIVCSGNSYIIAKKIKDAARDNDIKGQLPYVIVVHFNLAEAIQ